MPTLTEPADIGDLVAYEAPQQYSRKIVTIASGAGMVPLGTALGEITDSSKFVPSPATGSDGSEAASAVLLQEVDATSADVQAVVLARHSQVRSFGLAYESTVDDLAKKVAKHAQLEAAGIVVLPSA